MNGSSIRYPVAKQDKNLGTDIFLEVGSAARTRYDLTLHHDVRDIYLMSYTITGFSATGSVPDNSYFKLIFNTEDGNTNSTGGTVFDNASTAGYRNQTPIQIAGNSSGGTYVYVDVSTQKRIVLTNPEPKKITRLYLEVQNEQGTAAVFTKITLLLRACEK